MKINTIIVCYNSSKWIDRVLNSLKNSSVQTDIIVIDNGSEDGTLELIEKKHPEIHLFKSKLHFKFILLLEL